MMELTGGADGRYGLAYGGDTFNTAAYAARLGLKAAYATALGDDPFSDGIIALAERESVDMSLVPRRKGSMPGLYLIETKNGERSFYYWRAQAPARTLFEDAAATASIEALMRQTKIAYFSGITLSLYSPAGLDVFERVLRNARAAGAKLAFDSNYRARGWHGDAERARSTFKRFLALCDIALPSLDDEQALCGDKDAADTLVRFAALGVNETVVKAAAAGAYIMQDGTVVHLPPPEPIAPVDTTAAGDSFNAAYLARRLQGAGQREAVEAAHRLAGIVIRHPGAIAPRVATDKLEPTSAPR